MLCTEMFSPYSAKRRASDKDLPVLWNVMALFDYNCKFKNIPSSGSYDRFVDWNLCKLFLQLLDK